MLEECLHAMKGARSSTKERGPPFATVFLDSTCLEMILPASIGEHA